MVRNRLIPCLVISDGHLYNTKQFRKDKYVGDPINAVRIFNEKLCDELMLCDIDASKIGNSPNFSLIKEIAEEAKMPICYAGGVANKEQAIRLVDSGVEKIGLCSAPLSDISILEQCVEILGSQSVVAVIDYKRRNSLFNKKFVTTGKNNSVICNVDPITLAQKYQSCGVGEIIFNSVDRDGQRSGYDMELLARARSLLSVPLTALGGGNSLLDVAALSKNVGLVGAAGSTMFLYKGKLDAILIQYPNLEEKMRITEVKK